MIDTDVYSRQIADELTSETTRSVLAVAFLIIGALVVLTGIATAQPAVTAAGGFVALLGGIYAALVAFGRALSE